MKKILVLGAGLSASTLIKYLLDQAEELDWYVRVGDISEELAERKTKGYSRGESLGFNIQNQEQCETEVANCDLVVSLLPARFHYLVAQVALKYSKHMVTASYVSPEMKSLDAESREKGIVILNEIGVDPGIDHMSAMRVIDQIRYKGGTLASFTSNTGGLVAPKYDNNPWNYKFTWNPRNVVLAGQGVAQYIENGRYKYIPYHKLFTRIQRANVLNYGEFEVYANRDSLKYRETYGLHNIPTMYRGTMRRPGYAKAWNVFVRLGMTDDTYILEDSENMTWREFINTFLFYDPDTSVEAKLSKYLGIPEDSGVMYKLRWLGIFNNEKIGMKKATPAQVLQHLLEQKWTLDSDDKDMIVMQHQFVYSLNGEKTKITSSMVVEGKDQVHTAMSMTVGLPAAIAVKLILTGEITETGVIVPVMRSVYDPILNELEKYGVKFIEEVATV